MEKLPPSNLDPTLSHPANQAVQNGHTRAPPRWHLADLKVPLSVKFMTAYLALLLGTYIYDYLYYLWKIPERMELNITAEKRFTFVYEKTPTYQLFHIIAITPIVCFVLLLFTQWILSGLTKLVMTNEGRKQWVIALIENIVAMVIIAIVYTSLLVNTYAYLFRLGLLIMMFINIWRSGRTLGYKIGRSCLVLFLLVLLSGGGDIGYTTLLSYLAWAERNPAKYKAFFEKHNFDINSVYVIHSPNFTEAFSLGYRKGMIWMGDSLINPIHFGKFKAIALHEIGHCMHNHIVIKMLAIIPFSIIGLIYLGITTRKIGEGTLKKYLECCLIIYAASAILQCALNSYFQLHELDADRFAVSREPDLKDDLILSLLISKKYPDDFFVGEEPVVLEANEFSFIYPPHHPFHSHPSGYERYKNIM